MPGPSFNRGEGLDAAPPNPATDPRAAAESSPIRTLTGGQPPGGPGGMGGPGGQPGAPGAPGQPGAPGGMPSGPDNSGLVMLGQKVSDTFLILMQGMPEVAELLHQSQAMLDNALAQWMQQTMGGGGAGIAGGPPTQAMPTVSQAGSTFPGGGFGMGRHS